MKKQKLSHKIKKIKSVNTENYKVSLIYEDGKKVNVSLSPYFDKPRGLAAEILRGNLFDKCFIELGALAWPNGLEFCPDALLQLSQEQEDQGVA